MSRYVSICSKYGAKPFFIANFVIPWGAIACGKVVFGVMVSLGVGASVFGAESLLPRYLNKRKYGLSRGSKILRRTQFACVAVAVCAGSVLQIGFDRYVNLCEKPDSQTTSEVFNKHNVQEMPKAPQVIAQPVRTVETDNNVAPRPGLTGKGYGSGK